MVKPVKPSVRRCFFQIDAAEDRHATEHEEKSNKLLKNKK
jgi:hypothetical protein